MKSNDSQQASYKKTVKGLRRKLYAAVSMLLVSAIMLTSVSYAWYSFSTAPEVSKISTTVTGNGSLEIALATSDAISDLYLTEELESLTGFSKGGVYNADANTRWGNLIDLSDERYGFSSMSLYPSTLNVANNKVAQNPLRTAHYGKDGRVSLLSADSVFASFDQASHSFLIDKDQQYGVRAMGVSTSTGLWAAMEKTLRSTQQDGAQLLGNPFINAPIFSASFSPISLIETYTMGVSASDMADLPTAYATLLELVSGIDPVEATDTTPAVAGKDGIVDRLESAVLSLILACSGYSDRYVSVPSEEISAMIDDGTATQDIINNFVKKDTELSTICDLYLKVCASAQEMQTAYDSLMAAKPSGDFTHADTKPFIEAFAGNSFTTTHKAVVSRTVTVGDDVEETVLTHNLAVVSAASKAELDEKLEELKNPGEGEKAVISFNTHKKYVHIKAGVTDSFMSCLAQIAGVIEGESQSVNNDTMLNPLVMTFPTGENGCAVDKLSALEKVFVYNENLFELQSMWNELEIQRNLLAVVLKEELVAIGDIYNEALYVHLDNAFHEEYAYAKEESFSAHEENRAVKEATYHSPESASFEKFKEHVAVMEDTLEFYRQFTVQAAITYACKESTPLETYLAVKELTESTAYPSLEELFDVLGDSFKNSYAAAIEDYNTLKEQLLETNVKIAEYETMLREEQEEAARIEAETGTAPELPRHPTFSEDMALRSALVDMQPLADRIASYGWDDAYYYYGSYVHTEGGIHKALKDMGIGQDVYDGYYTVNKKKYYELYSDNSYHIIGRQYVRNDSEVPLFKAWTDIVNSNVSGEDVTGVNVSERISDITSYLYISEYDGSEYRSGYPLYYSAAELNDYYNGGHPWNDINRTPEYEYIYSVHGRYDSYSADMLEAIWGYTEELHSAQYVPELRKQANHLKNNVLPVAYNFVKETVHYFIEDIIADNSLEATVEIKDAAGNVTGSTTIAAIAADVVDSVLNSTSLPHLAQMDAALAQAFSAVEYAEFESAAQAITSSMVSTNNIWAYITEGAQQYDNITAQYALIDTEIKKLEESHKHNFTWEEYEPVLTLMDGEYSYYSTVYYYGSLSIEDGSAYQTFTSLFSDTDQLKQYNREGFWKNELYYVEQGPEKELRLRIWAVSNYLSGEHRGGVRFIAYVNDNPNQGVVVIDSSSCTMYSRYVVRTNSVAPDNGITPLYNLAVDNNKSVQTDRSIMFRQLVRDMKLSKYSAESSLEKINLDILGEYIGKTMYGQEFPTVTKELGVSVSVTDSSLAEAMPAVPENFSYDEVEMLLLEIDYIKTAMESYKDSLRTAFMLWAASANGTKDAYAAVVKNYTGTIDDMMAEANLKSGNLYYDIYTKVQDILFRLNGTANNLNLIMDEKPDEETDAGAEQPAETSVVAAEKLKNALIPLASDFKYLVTLRTPDTVSRLTLSSEHSVIGDIHSLYSFGENFAAVSYDFNSSNKGTVYTQFTVPEADLMQQAINAAVEGGATNNPADAVNKDAFAIMSDCYGFAIDVLLRTNAEGTNLLLQTDQKQRIYDSQYGEPETLGGGSAITYKTGDMTMAQLEEINKNMRVVFTDTATGEILACAKPYALEELVEDEFGIYTDETEEEPETGTEGENGEETTEKLPEELMGKLYLCDYTITDSGMLYFGDFYDRANIKPLVKNESTPITVLVYLDGHTINNSAVSGFADLQVNLNLQFASDAELIPTWGYEVDYMRPEEDSEKTETDTDTTTGTENGSDTNTDTDAENGGTAA